MRFSFPRLVLALFSGLLLPFASPAQIPDDLKAAQLGLCVMSSDGHMLADLASEKLLVPASNQKIITAGLALKHFGKDYRFKTELRCRGQVVGGALKGDLLVIGGGDPLFCLHEGDFDDLAAVWESALRKAGISRIEGNVIADGRFISGQRECDRWLWQDVGNYFGSGVSGLNFYGNVKEFLITPGMNPGDSLTVRDGYPSLPWLSYDCLALTGARGSGDQVYVFCSDMAPAARLRGTFAAGRRPKAVGAANKWPELTVAWYVKKRLDNSGLAVSGLAGFRSGENEATFYDELAGTLVAGAYSYSGGSRVLAVKESDSLDNIIRYMLEKSDNLCAELLFRVLGAELVGDSSYEAARQAAARGLAALGLRDGAVSGLRPADGSGLARTGLASPAAICSFLEAMWKQPEGPLFVSLFPSPGQGTVANLLKDLPAAKKAGLFIKSGSMEGVLCYSGYCFPAGKGAEPVFFSVMVNNYAGSAASLRAAVEKLLLDYVLENQRIMDSGKGLPL